MRTGAAEEVLKPLWREDRVLKVKRREPGEQRHSPEEGQRETPGIYPRGQCRAVSEEAGRRRWSRMLVSFGISSVCFCLEFSRDPEAFKPRRDMIRPAYWEALWLHCSMDGGLGSTTADTVTKNQ